MHGAVHGQGQGQEVEGVETSADVTAGLTLHLGLELTVEQIHHDGAVPAQVVLPRLQGGETSADRYTQHETHTQHQHKPWSWSSQIKVFIKTTQTQIRTPKSFISLILNTTAEDLGHVTDSWYLLPRCFLLQYCLVSFRFGFCGADHIYSLYSVTEVQQEDQETISS